MNNDLIIPIEELQYRIIYSVIVAGKSAKFADDAIVRFFSESNFDLPFDYVRWLIDCNILNEKMKMARVGNYKKISRFMAEIVDANFDLRTAIPEELERMHGIGPKTSRFFILWTRPNAQYAALDTHILKWLRAKGYDAPKSTPQNRSKYRKLEKIFIKEAGLLGKTPREFDHEIWSAYSNRNNER